MLISPVLQRLPAQFIKESVDATKIGSPSYGSSSFYVNSLQLLLASGEELSHTASQYSRRGRINDMYICSSDFLLTLNFSARMIYFFEHLPSWTKKCF